MMLLGSVLSGSGRPFLSATAHHSCIGSRGEVVCEPQDQCAAIAAWAGRESWNNCRCPLHPQWPAVYCCTYCALEAV